MARTEQGQGNRQGRHRIWLAVIFTFFAFPFPGAAQLGGKPEKSNFTISYTQTSGAFTPLWVAQEAGIAPVDLLQPADSGGRIGEGFGGNQLRGQGVLDGVHEGAPF